MILILDPFDLSSIVYRNGKNTPLLSKDMLNISSHVA